MEFSAAICYFFLLTIFSAILSSGTHIPGHYSNTRVRSISDIFRGYNRLPTYGRDLLDVHCYDTTGIRMVYDDCWNSPRTSDIVIRNRDESSRISSRRFAVYDSFGGTDMLSGYPDFYDPDIVVSPAGLGINCFDPTGVRIQYNDCWSSPKTRDILLTARGNDLKLNSRRFGVSNTYYGGSSLVSLVDEVEDCHCVTQERYYGDSRGILYVKMRPTSQFTADIRNKLLSMNWPEIDGCVPYDVVEVPYLPYIDNRLY